MSAQIIRKIDFDPEFEPFVFDSPVIEHEVLSGLEKSEGIVSRARKEASRLRKRAREVLAQAVVEKEEERKRGFEQGHQEGLAALTERLIQAEADRNRVLTEAEPQIVRMVAEIAEKVIGREIQNGAVVDIVKKAVSQSVGQRITVHVHPTDRPVLEEKEKELLEVVDKSQTITVKEDESVSAGGCIVETELGTVDARLETQLAAIRKALGLGGV